MSNSEYIKLSLELHLFFDRIMKEHSLFLEVAFVEKDNSFRNIARGFQKSFTDVLAKVIKLADGNISNKFRNSNEFVTKDTVAIESLTNSLLGGDIDITLTRRELELKIGNIKVSEQMLDSISDINSQTLPLIENLIRFKNDVLNNILSCKMYTVNYPLLISHIMNEAKMYYNLLSKVEGRKVLTKNEIYEQELFWNNIMKEHAEFIRGLLDPSEEALIVTADQYAKEYKMIMQNYSNDLSYLTDISLRETVNFRNFKVTGGEGILSCKIKSIIIPLLADHVVREANHFIRILEGFKV